MSRITGTGLVLGFLCLIGAFAAAAPAAKAKCSATGWRELDRSSLVIVQHRSRGNRLRACLRKTGRVRSLGAASGGSGGGATFQLLHVQTAGRFVAWESRGMFNGTAESSVHRLDATNGRKAVFEATTDNGQPIKDPAAPHQVDQLLLSSAGVLAWSAENQRAEPPRPELFKVDGGGRMLLDAGPTVNRSSLRFVGDKLVWKNGDEQRESPVVAGR